MTDGLGGFAIIGNRSATPAGTLAVAIDPEFQRRLAGTGVTVWVVDSPRPTLGAWQSAVVRIRAEVSALRVPGMAAALESQAKRFGVVLSRLRDDGYEVEHGVELARIAGTLARQDRHRSFAALTRLSLLMFLRVRRDGDTVFVAVRGVWERGGPRVRPVAGADVQMVLPTLGHFEVPRPGQPRMTTDASGEASIAIPRSVDDLWDLDERGFVPPAFDPRAIPAEMHVQDPRTGAHVFATQARFVGITDPRGVPWV